MPLSFEHLAAVIRLPTRRDNVQKVLFHELLGDRPQRIPLDWIAGREPLNVFRKFVFVGYCLAVASLLATFSDYQQTPWHAVLAPLCVLAVPIYETATIVIIRLRAGHSPFQADQRHFSHRLVQLGFSKPQAVLTIYLMTTTCGLGALLLARVDGIGAAVILFLVACILGLVAVLESTALRKSKV